MRIHCFTCCLLLWLFLPGCEKVEITTMDCPSFKDAGVDLVQPEVLSELTGDVPEGPRPSGAACESDDQCATQSCFSKEFLAEVAGGFGVEWTYDIPGGMCSMLFCATDEQCGPGGFCFDVAPLFGAEGMTIGLCLKACENYADCRYQEGYHCYFTGVEGEQACLPAGIIADIPCGDGICDELESLTPEKCPRDCP